MSQLLLGVNKLLQKLKIFEWFENHCFVTLRPCCQQQCAHVHLAWKRVLPIRSSSSVNRLPWWTTRRRCPSQAIQPNPEASQRAGGEHRQVHLQRTSSWWVQSLCHSNRRMSLWQQLWRELLGNFYNSFFLPVK